MSGHDSPTILAVGAHHDDNELLAGTLSHHRQRGWRVVSVVVTDGRVINGEAVSEHVAVRERESLQAAAVLDMQCEFMRLPEGDAAQATHARPALTRLLRKHRPAVVITHPPRDYHLDHMWVSRCVFEAVHTCWNPAVEPDLEPCPRPLLYYGDAWFVPFEPDEYVDISDALPLKQQALRCHRSQLPAASGEPTMLDLAVLRDRARGVEAGCAYAEAFRLAPGPGALRVGALLGGFFIKQ